MSDPTPRVRRRRSDGEEVRTLEQLLATREIVISCGSGGVGKTTTAAAAAAMAATHLGGKVLVLTVDPARRQPARRPGAVRQHRDPCARQAFS